MAKTWLGLLLFVTACAGAPRTGTAPASSASASVIECAPFARQLSGIALYGEAHTWWDQAPGRYDRASTPVDGGVLVFRRSTRLPSGHVSVVARRISDREIRVTQANWVHHHITRDDPVIDVSPANDWSRVRVWWAPIRALGATEYPAYGFILPAAPRPPSDLLAGLAPP